MVERMIVGLDKELFVSVLDDCEDMSRWLGASAELLSEKVYNKFSLMIESKIDILNELLELEETEEFGTIIDHYVYESDFGKTNMNVYDKNGLIIHRTTDAGKLWDWILLTKSQRKG